MSRWKPILAALVTAFVANLVGVLLFFKPIADGDTVRFEINPAAGLFTYVVLCVALFDWTARQIESAYKAAFIVAGSQFILVIDLMLRGDRGLATAAAGAANRRIGTSNTNNLTLGLQCVFRFFVIMVYLSNFGRRCPISPKAANWFCLQKLIFITPDLSKEHYI